MVFDFGLGSLHPGIAGKSECADAISMFHYLESSENVPPSAIQLFYGMGCPF